MITGKKRKFVPIEAYFNGSSKAMKEEQVDNREYDKVEEKTVKVTAHSTIVQKGSFNSNILYDYIRKPHLYPNYVLYDDEKCVIIKDAYPKAAIHLLLIPKETYLLKNSARELVPDDIAQVKLLHTIAASITSEIKQLLSPSVSSTSFEIPKGEPKLGLPAWFVNEIMEKNSRQTVGNFMFGFHVIPSLYPLHLHIITTDFVSACLKTKKHWNSFTTNYFLQIGRVEEILEENIQIRDLYNEEECEELLKQKMKCNECSVLISTIPYLKKHQITHFPVKD